jgi:hypothetical protein
VLSDEVVFPNCVNRHIVHLECMEKLLSYEIETEEEKDLMLHNCPYKCG